MWNTGPSKKSKKKKTEEGASAPSNWITSLPSEEERMKIRRHYAKQLECVALLRGGTDEDDPQGEGIAWALFVIIFGRAVDH